MSKNPFLNAFTALIYIIIVVLIMTAAGKFLPKQDSFIDPIAILSLFTLSAVVMGFIFFYQPGQLYFSGKKKQAVDLFLKTVSVFAALTVIILVLLFSKVIK